MNTRTKNLKARISIQLTENLKKQAQDKAEKENINLSALMRGWLENWVKGN